MLRRPPREGRQSQQPKLLLALAIILLPWLPLANAQQPQSAASPLPDISRATGSSQQLSDDAAVHNWAATPIDAAHASRETAKEDSIKRAAATRQRRQQYYTQQHQQQQKQHALNRKHANNEHDHLIVPDDASALATLAPAQAVRAPFSSRHQRSSSIPASGLASQQIARSLEDWDVEDFVLLATVNGDLYANERKTGKERWHLEVDQPMVDTQHFRLNQSVLDDSFQQVDHYIWAVEPNRDGGIYVWIPESDAGLVWTGFTMKRLVDDLVPYEDNTVVYTGDKKTTMITLDAATGRVLKWFGSGGSHVDEAESCLQQPNTLYDKDNQECSSTGSITLGRTEYTVGIQRRDGLPIATLKYAEWTTNNFDSDLSQQHQTSLDSWYITSKHDGRVYAFDYTRSEAPAPRFRETFSAPVVRVFDVCRPWDAPKDSNTDLIVLPHPTMPSQDGSVDQMRSNSIFLNQTSTGSWYAMSGRFYPLIVHAPAAKISSPEFWDTQSTWETISQTKLSKALAGNHFLDNAPAPAKRHLVTLPPGSIDNNQDEELNNDSTAGELVEGDDEVTIISKVKSMPRRFVNHVVELLSNPILIIVLVITLFVNRKQIRHTISSVLDQPFMLSANSDGSLSLTKPDDVADRMPLQSDGQLVDETNKSNLEEIEILDTEDVAKQKSHKDPLTEKTSDGQDGFDELLTKATALNDEDAKDDRAENPVAGEQLSDRKPLSEVAVNGQALDDGAPEKKKKKAHRGRRGGVKHRKGPRNQEQSQSRGDENTLTMAETIEDVNRMVDKSNKQQRDVETVTHDMSAVGGPTLRMGGIEVNTDVQLGTGSNGTIVFAGRFDGRDVAVKRLLMSFYDVASQETKLLRESDDHPNVVRYYAQERYDEFLYIALELCAGSLADVIETPQCFPKIADAGRRDRSNVLYQIANGIDHLHGLRIVHRDLKPQNILVNMGKDGKPRLLVSDFGLCKKLEGGQSSFGATTGRNAGTTGWRAPELLLDEDGREATLLTPEHSAQSGSANVLVQDGVTSGLRRATRAIDIFSLGLVFYYVLTEGSHPFDCGGKYMREVNIRNKKYDLSGLDPLGDVGYEAKDLISGMLRHNPKERPSTREVMAHPFFWSAKKKLTFLCDVSDHFEKEPRDPPSAALVELERFAETVIETGDFLRQVGRDFADSLGKQRKYSGGRLLDLLRALRNKKNHYEDMPENLQRLVGPLPAGYLQFWTTRFPMLLLVCWNVVFNVGWEDTDRFREYYEPAGL